MTIPTHHSTEATAGDRGVALGRAQADRIARNAEVYMRLFEQKAGLGTGDVHRLGADALGRIGAFAPYLADEIQGIASGAEMEPALIAAINARTEILCAGRGECSTVAVLGGATASGEPIGVQTWDWHEELSDSWLQWTIDHPSGHRVETMTEAGQVGKIGVSSAGIGLLVNILGHRDDGPPIGVPVHVLNRAVLDNAGGSVEALAMLAGAKMSASSAVTLVADDEDGGAICTAELSPAGPGFLTPDERGVLVHTNHFVADPGRSGDTMVIEGPDSVLRLDHARRAMARQVEGEIDEDSILDAMRSHRGGAGAICCHPAADAGFGDRWRTLATVVVEPAKHRLALRRGGPCGHVDVAPLRGLASV